MNPSHFTPPHCAASSVHRPTARPLGAHAAALLLLLVGWLPVTSARAQSSGNDAGAAGSDAPNRSPATPTVATAPANDDYTQQVAHALVAMFSGDVASARQALSQLARAHPDRLAARCHLAEAIRMAGDLEPALTQYRECAQLARQSGELWFQARGLLGAAQTLARMDGKLVEAKEAFEELLTFAQAHADIVAPDRVQGRVTALEAMIAADAAAAPVRARRQERAAELAASANDDDE